MSYKNEITIMVKTLKKLYHKNQQHNLQVK